MSSRHHTDTLPILPTSSLISETGSQERQGQKEGDAM